jgi:hypothetical protein
VAVAVMVARARVVAKAVARAVARAVAVMVAVLVAVLVVGMVHTWVGQKLLKNYIFKSFLMSRS